MMPTTIVNALFSQVQLHHIYVEGIILIVLILILVKKTTHYSKKKKLSEDEIEEKIKSWTPKPMVDVSQITKLHMAKYTVESKAKSHVIINGRSCVNFATHNYYNFLNDDHIEEQVIKAVRTYGIGSCGPRAFYGTFDIHIELEEKIADFMGLEEAVIYSYGFSTVTSAIQAYVKSKDLVFVDEEVNFAIQKGLQASRAEVLYFKHNSPEDLERLILDKSVIKRRRNRRTFLIVEGIYTNTGNICNLPELIRIRIEHKIRIFIDETMSFGILGKNGQGITEHFNIPRKEVDLIIGSLETALASVGGFCVGTRYVVEHQRLSGLGYCFSASLPPLLAAAAMRALEQIEKCPEKVAKLQERSMTLHDRILESQLTEQFILKSDRLSPLKHLYIRDESLSNAEQQLMLNNIVDYCISNGIAITTAAYLTNQEYKTPRPSIKLLASISITDKDITSLTNSLSKAVCEAYQKHHELNI